MDDTGIGVVVQTTKECKSAKSERRVSGGGKKCFGSQKESKLVWRFFLATTAGTLSWAILFYFILLLYLPSLFSLSLSQSVSISLSILLSLSLSSHNPLCGLPGISALLRGFRNKCFTSYLKRFPSLTQ